MPVTVAVFDLGNVTVSFQPEQAVERLLAHCRVPDRVSEVLFRSEATHQLEVGEIEPLAYFEIVKRELGLDLSADQFVRLWSDIFMLNGAALDVIRRVTGVRKYLLSNTNPVHVEWIQQRFPGIFDPYDRTFFSYEVHLRKPDPAIFRLILEASGRPASEHVFADDTEAHVEAARRVGMQGIVFRSAGQLAEELAGLGVHAE